MAAPTLAVHPVEPMMDTPPTVTRLVLAGVAFTTRVHGPVDPRHVTARFGGFTAGTDSPDPAEDITVDITVDPAWRPRRALTAVFPAAEAEHLPDGGVRFLRACDELTYRPADRRAVGVTAGTPAVLAPVVDPTPLDTPLRLLMAYELPRRHGMLVHACGYADARGAVVFLAPSGGGKTTTARKLPAGGVLSDDQVALRQGPEGWTAWALPFVGEYARAIAPRCGPLRAVVLLTRGSTVRLTRVSPGAAALPRVLGGTVYFVRDDPRAGGLLDLAADLVARVPVYTLAMTLEAPVDAHLDVLLG